MLASQKFIKLRISAYKKLSKCYLPNTIGLDNASHFYFDRIKDFNPENVISYPERFALRNDFRYYFPKGIINFLKENVPEEDKKYLDWSKRYLFKYFQLFIKWRIKQLELYLENTKKCNAVIRNQRK